MTKKIFLFISILISSNAAWSMQSFLRLSEEMLSNRSRLVSRHFLSPRIPVRLHSTTPFTDQPSALERSKTMDALSTPQTYGITTYDALFKHVLSEDKIRPSFFHAFIPNLKIKSSKRLDDHMNPLQDLQLLREFVHRKDTLSTVKRLTSSPGVLLGTLDSQFSFSKDNEATIFLHEILGHFGDIQKSFPIAKYDGTMDFVCELDNDEYAMVEMQVIPQDYWDNRALAYVAAFYGNQLRKGGDWKHIRKVIGINILGGGKEDKTHWEDTPDEYIRHYKFQEQIHKVPQGRSKRYIDGMELIQYSVMNAPDSNELDSEKQDWITFFKKGHHMTEQQVKETITTPAVLQAFERAKLAKLPHEVKAIYDAEDREYDRFSQHTKQLIDAGTVKGIEQGRKEGLLMAARAMKNLGIPATKISEELGLTEDEISRI